MTKVLASVYKVAVGTQPGSEQPQHNAALHIHGTAARCLLDLGWMLQETSYSIDAADLLRPVLPALDLACLLMHGAPCTPPGTCSCCLAAGGEEGGCQPVLSLSRGSAPLSLYMLASCGATALTANREIMERIAAFRNSVCSRGTSTFQATASRLMVSKGSLLMGLQFLALQLAAERQQGVVNAGLQSTGSGSSSNNSSADARSGGGGGSSSSGASGGGGGGSSGSSSSSGGARGGGGGGGGSSSSSGGARGGGGGSGSSSSGGGGGSGGGTSGCADFAAFLGVADPAQLGSVGSLFASSRAAVLGCSAHLLDELRDTWSPRAPPCARCAPEQLLLVVEAATLQPERALENAQLTWCVMVRLHELLVRDHRALLPWLGAFLPRAMPTLSAWIVAAAQQLPASPAASSSAGATAGDSSSAAYLAQAVAEAAGIVIPMPGSVLDERWRLVDGPEPAAGRQQVAAAQLLAAAELAMCTLCAEPESDETARCGMALAGNMINVGVSAGV